MNIKASNSDYPCGGANKWNMGSIRDKIVMATAQKKIPDFGLERVEIHPSSLCQYRCPFCYGINFKDKAKINLPLDDAEKNIFKSISENKKLSKYNPLIILAGLYSEPLIYKDIVGLIELIGKYNFRFGIYTNGESLNNELMRSICESAKRTKGDKHSYVSFNVSASIINKRYKPLLKKIRKFVELKNKLGAPVEVNVPFLIYDNCLAGEGLKRVQSDLLGIGVDRIRYSIPQVPVSKKESINIKNIKLVKNLQASGKGRVYIKSKSDKQFDHCYIMANTVSIDCRGDVYPCSQTCASFFGKFRYGSIRNKELAEIWDSKEHRAIFYNFDRISTYCRCNTTDNQFNTMCSILDNII